MFIVSSVKWVFVREVVAMRPRFFAESTPVLWYSKKYILNEIIFENIFKLFKTIVL